MTGTITGTDVVKGSVLIAIDEVLNWPPPPHIAANFGVHVREAARVTFEPPFDNYERILERESPVFRRARETQALIDATLEPAEPDWLDGPAFDAQWLRLLYMCAVMRGVVSSQPIAFANSGNRLAFGGRREGLSAPSHKRG